MQFNRKKILKILLWISILTGVIAVLSIPAYYGTKWAFYSYFDRWGRKLVKLDEKGLLSREYGAAWKDVLEGEAINRKADAVTGSDENERKDDRPDFANGIKLEDYPSLSIVKRLNEVDVYSNLIQIADRKDREIASIKTDHTRADIEEFPEVLIKALIAAEDSDFFRNDKGINYKSYVRAAMQSIKESLLSFSLVFPSGTSTITQQVAKLFISHVDTTGKRFVSRTVQRKIREMRIASALRKAYAPEEILEVYCNHCVTSDYGLIGFKDIAEGLFGKKLDELSDAQCVYLARMVKWGQNIPRKIYNQCRIDMPRIAKALNWDKEKRKNVLNGIKELDFIQPKRVRTDHGHLVDLANEYWFRILKDRGRSENFLLDMNIIDPNSLIRKKGNLYIRLNIDLGLQKELERLVDARGYGPDTVINSDVRIGSFGEDVKRDKHPRDTIREISIVKDTSEYSETGSDFVTTLVPGDTLVTNVRYKKKGEGVWRRSCFYYTRRSLKVDGQYYSYCILDSRTGKLLAYYSRDKIGSRLNCLIHNRVPNGSSTAKPVFNALNFDLGIFEPDQKWSDSIPVEDDVPWKRDVVKTDPEHGYVVFQNGPWKGKTYEVHNHGYVFEGCRYIFDQLAVSNNILGVETVYRLNRTLFNDDGDLLEESYPFVNMLYRIGALKRVKDTLNISRVTGVRIYKELVRFVGVNPEFIIKSGKRIPITDSMYSVGLGTVELTLLEQAHVFNMLYNNTMVSDPADHPSLFIDTIVFNDIGIDVESADTIRRCHPFSDLSSLRPTWLGLHKRLVSNPWDGLKDYDVPYNGTKRDNRLNFFTRRKYDPDKYMVSGPLSNYAKSGTTDDILRPFNADVTSKRKTNYGLWNAVVRLDISKFDSISSSSEIRDVTIACIGECNEKYTGARDGKSLHKFLSKGLLKKAGKPFENGYFNRYEEYLKNLKPDSTLCEKEKRSFFDWW